MPRFYIPTLLLALTLVALPRVGQADVTLAGSPVSLLVNEHGTLGNWQRSLGLSYDAPGPTGPERVGDAVAAGYPWEGFSVAHDGMYFANELRAAGVPMRTLGAPEGDFLVAVSEGGTDWIEIRQELRLSPDGSAAIGVARITNRSAHQLERLQYGRGLDPDPDHHRHHDFRTENDVLEQLNLVIARGPSSGLMVGLGSIDPASHVGTGPQWPFYDPGTGARPLRDPQGQQADWGIGATWDLGALDPGASVCVSWVWAMEFDEARLRETYTRTALRGREFALDLCGATPEVAAGPGAAGLPLPFGLAFGAWGIAALFSLVGWVRRETEGVSS